MFPFFIFSQQENNIPSQDSIYYKNREKLSVTIDKQARIYVTGNAVLWAGQEKNLLQNIEIVYLKTSEKQTQRVAKLQKAIKVKRPLCRLDKHKDVVRKRYIEEKARTYRYFIPTEQAACFYARLSFTKGIQVSSLSPIIAITCAPQYHSRTKYWYQQIQYIFYSDSNKENHLLDNCFNRPPPFFA